MIQYNVDLQMFRYSMLKNQVKLVGLHGLYTLMAQACFSKSQEHFRPENQCSNCNPLVLIEKLAPVVQKVDGASYPISLYSGY